MPRGRSTFTKRQKEQARQQRQREKAQRKIERKQQPKPEILGDDDSELHEHAAAQAALFRVGEDELPDMNSPAGQESEDCSQ